MFFDKLVPFLPQVITALAALLGVWSSSYFLHLNANRALNEQRQLKFDEMRIVNLENLYLLFARWKLNADNIYLLSLRRHKGLLSRSQENELLTNKARDTENSLGKITMLVKLHFPEINDFLEKVLEARSANAGVPSSRDRPD